LPAASAAQPWIVADVRQSARLRHLSRDASHGVQRRSLPAILRAATINNARPFGLDRDYGTVERGKLANLLLLKSNPLESIEAWSQIDGVILRGAALEREPLAAGRSGSGERAR
jgi:imidazolonepropionase-like amidohydrolase